MSGWSLRLESLSDRLNPVAVKELRQIAEGRFIIFLLLGLVAVETLMVGGALLAGGNSQTTVIGRGVFGLLYSILTLSCLLLVPTYIGWRLAAERYGDEMDLIYITTISPRHIVTGKLLSAVGLTALIFSTFLPFLGLTYYLRGVDLAAIFGLVVFSFVTVVLATLAAMLMGALPVSRGVKVVIAAGTLLFLLQFAGLGLFAAMAMISRGGGGFGFFIGSSLMSSPPGMAWVANVFLISVMVILALLLFQIVVALLTPAAANRARAFRLTLFWCWLLSGAASVALTISYSEDFFIIAWCFLFSLLLSAAFFVAVSERHSFGRRILRGLPRQGWKRWRAFLFSSGAASGVFFYVFLGAATLAATHLVSVGTVLSGDLETWLEVSAGLLMYSLGYSLIGVLIYRSFFKRRLHPKRTGLIAVGVLAVASVAPLTLGALLAPEYYWNSSTGFRNFLMGNPFALGYESHRGAYLVLGVILSAGGLIGCASWIGDQFERFRPPPPARAQPSPRQAVGKAVADG